MTNPQSYGAPQQQPPAARGDDKFVSALLDLSFTKYITLNMVKVLYIIGLILIALTWLWQLATLFFVDAAAIGGSGLSPFAEDPAYYGYSDSYGYGFEPEPTGTAETGPVGTFFLFLLFTAVAFFQIIMLRITLEAAQALVRASRAWRNIKARQEQGLIAF